MPRRSDKRERLIAAAREVIYHHGYANTTLAQVAEAANVPLGNVYYYFKTKESLAQAVIDLRMQEVRSRIQRCNLQPTPTERLIHFLHEAVANRDLVARYGCPYGSLTQELEKHDDALAEQAKSMLREQLRWARTQFLALNKSPQEAESLALQFLSQAQGVCLITNTFGDPDIMRCGFDNLRSWVQTQS